MDDTIRIGGGVSSPSPGRLAYLSSGGKSSAATLCITKIITPAVIAFRISLKSSTLSPPF